MDCLHCNFSDCVNDSDILDESEVSFSNTYDKAIKDHRREQEIKQIENPKARATAKYRRTPKGKEQVHKMNTSPLAKERFSRYEKTDKAKERRKRHEAKPERIAYRKKYMESYNKELYKRQKAEKDKQRQDYIKTLSEDLILSSTVIVRGKIKNRPREIKICDEIQEYLSGRFIIEYDETIGSVTIHKKGEKKCP